MIGKDYIKNSNMGKEKVKFEQISRNEVKFIFRDKRFLLLEKDRGVYGLGRGVQLYELDGVNKTHVKEIGWTKSDNHGGANKADSHLPGIQTWDSIKTGAIDYLQKLLD